MKFIFIRHAEPYYQEDSLTEKGFREAKLLAQRTKNWRVTQFIVSSMGRAQATAQPTLDAHKVELTVHYPEPAPDVLPPFDPKKAIVYPWLQEFEAPLPREEHPMNQRIPWDFSPEFMSANPLLYDPVRWREVPIVSKGQVREVYDYVCSRLDAFLEQLGYVRKGNHYTTPGNQPASDWYMKHNGTTLECMKQLDDSEPVIVCFCHLGIMMAMLSHLINTSPYTLWQGMFIPPASVTIVGTEERVPGHAQFRCQTIGDTAHLREGGEPVSFYGGFYPPFQM